MDLEHTDLIDPDITRIRRAVQREGAEKYLLITLFSFAASVSLTRLFLELTGYPQIATSTLHIAHVLWGGLLLYIASLIPLLFANRWVYTLTAVLSGVGIGLFIDEVGKFITQENDYFYPPAAPIIYAFFLLTVLLYRRVRRPRELDVRSELYGVLEGLEEVLDHDLSDRERHRLIQRLELIAKETDQPNIIHLVRTLENFIAADTLFTREHTPDFFEKVEQRFREFEDRWITRKGLRVLLAGGLAAMGAWVLSYPALVAYQLNNPQLEIILRDLVDANLVTTQTGLNWFQARLVLQTAVGLILFISGLLLVVGFERRGIGLSYLGLLLSLTTVTLLMFYFDQFSTILSALMQFGLFIIVMYFRGRFLENNNGNSNGYHLPDSSMIK